MCKTLPDVLGTADRLRDTLVTSRVDVYQSEGVAAQPSIALSVDLARIEYLLLPGGPQQQTVLAVLVVHSAGTEAESAAPQTLDGSVAGQYEEVAPAETAAVLLLHGPEQPPCLVQVGVVVPAPLRLKPLAASLPSAPSVPRPEHGLLFWFVLRSSSRSSDWT